MLNRTFYSEVDAREFDNFIIHNLTGYDLTMKEANVELHDGRHSTNDHNYNDEFYRVWKSTPPEVIKSNNSGHFLLSGPSEEPQPANEKVKSTWNLDIMFEIGNTGRKFTYQTYTQTNAVNPQFIDRINITEVPADYPLCDNGLYIPFVWFTHRGTKICLARVIKSKNIVFHSTDDHADLSKVSVGADGRVGFSYEPLLKHAADKKIVALKKTVTMDIGGSYVGSDGTGVDIGVFPVAELWALEQTELHCPDSELFDFKFPQRLTAPGLTYSIKATVMSDEDNKKITTNEYVFTSALAKVARDI